MFSYGLILCGLFLLPTSTRGETFDHNAQHCHDVSVWGEVDYRDETCEKCETKFEQICVEKIEQVCLDVPTTRCELILFPDCEQYTDDVPYNTTIIVPTAEYIPWECSNFTQLETHIKLVPKCINVTRQDCVTKWVVTATGEKIWDGNEDCRPVTWMNCTLHEEPKLFNQTYTKCKKSGVPIPTMKCELEERTRSISGTRCTVKSAVNCTCEHVNECKELIYNECYDSPMPISCEQTTMRTPYQPKIHRVKCLLADNGDAPELIVEDSAAQADIALDIDTPEAVA